MLSETACPDKSKKSRLSAAKAGSVGKTIIFIAIVFVGLITVGCSTYLSLTENHKEQIEEQLKYDEKDENVGVEITLLQMNDAKINGELLSVREYSVTICTKHSATEAELANMSHPISTVQNEEIQEITIEGESYFWTGLGYGALSGAALGAISFFVLAEESRHNVPQGTAALVGGVLGVMAGAIVGGIIGAISNDDIILQDIPPSYDLSILKPLARYPREEPEYLQAIE